MGTVTKMKLHENTHIIVYLQLFHSPLFTKWTLILLRAVELFGQNKGLFTKFFRTTLFVHLLLPKSKMLLKLFCFWASFWWTQQRQRRQHTRGNLSVLDLKTDIYVNSTWFFVYGFYTFSQDIIIYACDEGEIIIVIALK